MWGNWNAVTTPRSECDVYTHGHEQEVLTVRSKPHDTRAITIEQPPQTRLNIRNRYDHYDTHISVNWLTNLFDALPI